MHITDLQWSLQNKKWNQILQALEADPGLARQTPQQGGYTFLHKCANFDDEEVLAIIDKAIGLGADVNARDLSFAGTTPLHIACSEHGNLPRNLKLSERLLAAGADPNAQTLTRSDIERYQKTRQLAFTGLAPLHFALRQPNSELISLLLRYGASRTLHTYESDYGSPIDSCRRGKWRMHLPELLKVRLDHPLKLALSLKAADEEPPSAYQCMCSFIDPQSLYPEPGTVVPVAPPPVMLDVASAPGAGEVRCLVPEINVPLAVDGLPCNLQLDISAAGEAKRLLYGEYIGKGVQYSPAFLPLSVVNLQKGGKYEYTIAMARGLGPATFTGMKAHRLIVGVQVF